MLRHCRLQEDLFQRVSVRLKPVPCPHGAVVEVSDPVRLVGRLQVEPGEQARAHLVQKEGVHQEEEGQSQKDVQVLDVPAGAVDQAHPRLLGVRGARRRDMGWRLPNGVHG